MKGFGTRGVVRRIREVQDVLDLTVRKADFIFPALKQVYSRSRLAHALGQLTEASVIAHRPLFDRFHPPHGVFHRGERHAAQLGVEFLQPFAQSPRKCSPPCFIAFKGHPEAFHGHFSRRQFFLKKLARALVAWHEPS